MDDYDRLLAEAADFLPDAPPAQLWQRLDWLDRLDRLGACATGSAAVAARLEAARTQAEACNEVVFEHLRNEVRRGHRPALEGVLAERAGPRLPPVETEGFDALDEFFAGLLRLPVPGPPQAPLTGDMVAYQPTPARHVLDLLARLALAADDVLVDLGAGLGQVPLMAALLSKARAVGIEIEPAYVACAREGAMSLRLARASFRCEDLREADLSTGTVFHLYTPLRGTLMAALLDRLRQEASRRPLRVSGFGPCVQALAAQPWLRPVGEVRTHRVTVFSAR